MMGKQCDGPQVGAREQFAAPALAAILHSAAQARSTLASAWMAAAVIPAASSWLLCLVIVSLLHAACTLVPWGTGMDSSKRDLRQPGGSANAADKQPLMHNSAIFLN